MISPPIARLLAPSRAFSRLLTPSSSAGVFDGQAYYGGGSMPLGLPEPFAPGLSDAMANAAAAMASGDPSVLMALRAQLAGLEEQNRWPLMASDGL